MVLDFPLESIHQNAFGAAEATHCAGDQGKYWEMHERLFSNQRALAASDLPAHAQALGLDVEKFQQCLDSHKYQEQIRKDIQEGQQAGVTGTPAFFLGLTDPNSGKVKTLQVVKGAQPYENFKNTIDSLLAAPQ